MYRFSRILGIATQGLLVLAVVVLFGRPAIAIETGPDADPHSESEWKERVNGGTVRIITKGLGCTCTNIASDMARVLNEVGDIRVLPVIGRGSLLGIADVIHLKGIDMSILQSDVLAYVERNGIHRNISGKVRYVTKLYNSELHLIAGPGIKSIQDLDGKTVSYDVKGRGSFITAQNVFDQLGVKPVQVNLERDVAIEKIRTGEIAAAFVVTGKPAASMRQVKPGDGLHLLPIPFVPGLADIYLPSKLTSEDYPNLIPAGQVIETIAVGEVLAVYNWKSDSERYRKLSRFVDKLFTNIQDLKFQEPIRHPKWKEINIATDLPGWKRFTPAQDWLDANTRRPEPLVADMRDKFETFLAANGSTDTRAADNQNELFQRFLVWSSQQ